MIGPLLTLMMAATPCPMAPPETSFVLPATGFVWASGGEEGACDKVDAGEWTRVSAGEGELAVAATGPEGSGRYWVVTVGLAAARGGEPARGVCLMASTLGWRTMQDEAPLEWVRRAQGSEAPEIVLWDTFQADTESPADAALVAWVYQLRGDSLVLDLESTRRLAAKLAAVYRKPLPREGSSLREIRGKAATALTALAEGRCTVAGR
ncbi:MAG TPA: hypothetical protein VMW27_12065 [Thermoanaerobaculia bacterium]|nr:hypothetical protein [Thermoanaerobaculia bacterium]